MFENVIDKKLVFKGAKKKFTKELKYIVLHHSGASADQKVETIHDYHINHNGWIGVGYNALVDKNGIIYWGRGLEYIGAHCKGYNEVSFGICAIGNMDTDQMPDAQKNSINKLVQDIKAFYPTITVVCGHKEMPEASTDCPGKNYPLNEIVNAKAVKVTEPTAFTSYKIKTTAKVLNIRAGAGTNFKVVSSIKDKNIYTIVDEADGDGAKKWGKLKSGIGWISLDYVVRV